MDYINRVFAGVPDWLFWPFLVVAFGFGLGGVLALVALGAYLPVRAAMWLVGL